MIWFMIFWCVGVLIFLRAFRPVSEWGEFTTEDIVLSIIGIPLAFIGSFLIFCIIVAVVILMAIAFSGLFRSR